MYRSSNDGTVTENHSDWLPLVISQAGNRDLAVAVDVRGDIGRCS